MKKLCIAVLAGLSVILNGCSSDCTRIDYGRLQAGFFNERKEKLPNLTIGVYPIKLGEFGNRFNSDLTSLSMVEDYYGAQIVETDENGLIDVQVNAVDGTSSCDGPRETFDNSYKVLCSFINVTTGP